MPLITAHWIVNNSCNMQCPFCYKPECGSDQILEDRRWVIERLAKAGIIQLTLTGGEPLLAADTYELIKHARNLGIKTTLHTNAQTLTYAKIEQLSGVLDNLGLGLDASTPALADRIRCKPGYFKQVIQVAYWAQCLDLNISVKTMVCQLNLHDIPVMAQLVPKILGRSQSGLWYLSEFTPIRNCDQTVDSHLLQPGEFAQLQRYLASLKQPARVWSKSKEEIAKTPYFFINPIAEVFSYDRNTGRDRIVGSMRHESVHDLWDKILHFNTLSNRVNHP